MECPDRNADLNTLVKRHTVQDATFSANSHCTANETFLRVSKAPKHEKETRQIHCIPCTCHAHVHTHNNNNNNNNSYIKYAYCHNSLRNCKGCFSDCRYVNFETTSGNVAKGTLPARWALYTTIVWHMSGLRANEVRVK